MIKYVVFLSMMLLSSCSKRPQNSGLFHKSDEKTTQALLSDEFEQAKNIDISIPLGFSIIKKEEQPLLEHLILEGHDTLDHIKIFYTKEMERLGWEIVDLSTSQETMLICKNTKKYCVISARHYEVSFNPKISLHIFAKRRHADIESAPDAKEAIPFDISPDFFNQKGTQNALSHR